MKLGFGVLLLIHTVIHLTGFAKAFYLTETTKQALATPKTIGALWGIVFVLFMVTSSLLFNHKKWFYIAFIAVCFSQILIIMAWEDAKLGTFANALILLVSIAAFGKHKFNTMVAKETAVLFESVKTNDTSIITKKDIAHLPEIVQKWMINSGTLNNSNIVSVRLKQSGELKTKPSGKWMPFTAKQYFNTNNPSFIWSTHVKTMPLINMLGRDKLTNGKGEMLIKLGALIPVVNASGNLKINSGTMQRFLSEMCWFPSAALNKHITWEAIDNTSAKALLTLNNKSVSGVFKFNAKGDVLAFETDRYFGADKRAKLEKWVIKMIDYKVFRGYKIPYKCEVTWQLKDGDFNWLKLEITDLEYNISNPY